MNIFKSSYLFLRRAWGLSIRRQLTGAFVLVSTVIILASGQLLYTYQRDFQYTHGNNNALELAQALAYSSSSWVLANDVAGLQEVLKGAAHATDIKFAVVLSPQGEVMASTRPEYIGQVFSDALSQRLLAMSPERHILIDADNLIDVAVPVKSADRLIGWVRVELSRETANANLHAIAAAGLGIAVFFVLMIALIASALARGLTAGLARLARVADEAERGHEFQRKDILREDEIGILARHLYLMLDTVNEEKRANLESEARLRTILDSVDAYIYLKDGQGNYLFANRAVRELWHAGMDEIIGFGDEKFFDAATAANLRCNDSRVLQEGATLRTEEVNTVEATGKTYVYQSTKLPLRAEDGRIYALCGISVDITELKQTEADLRIAATAFESQEGMLVTDADSRILRVNRAFTGISGYEAEEAIGKTPSMLKSGRHDADFYDAMWKDLNQTGGWEGEIWNRRKNGEIHPEHLTITSVKDKTGLVSNYVATLTDITKSKRDEENIRNLAFYDSLTGLPNRRLLMDRLNQALVSRARSGRQGALLFIDLDNFKTLNDTLGHETGDRLLQQVALRLESCVREGDTVARLGGDEFVVMLENLGEQAVEAAAQTEAIGVKILANLNVPYQLATHEHHSTPSIGATLFDDHKQGAENLLRQADIAMYQAKKAGRNTLRFFDPQMQDAINQRAALEVELRSALESSQFELYYQIQVDKLYHMKGAEALIRWLHPEHGLITPDRFIPLAEESGLILPLGNWVLETACAQIHAWQQSVQTRDLVLAINVSARQFRQANFVAQVRAAVEHHAIDPIKLKLELTESMLLENIEDTIASMKALKSIGVQFSLDDFGTGYSSLQYLKRLPLDQLKIDQSFVRDIVADGSDQAIVRTIIAMAHSLNLKVIAEGVETEVQRQCLLSMGCTHFQGYLFGKPVPVSALL
ncbi:MAG: hypothetical protein A2342_04215, partial [Gallionellales bacterium RIFOXYB12_FULL_54_9]